MPAYEGTLLAVERQRIILETLDREGAVRNAELTELLSVSMATIRSDLRELESAGVCEVIWGGAVSKRRLASDSESFLAERSKLHPDAKRRIGARAAQLVEMGQTIIVDAGSTTVELVHHLPRDWDYLRIVTYALNVATIAAQFPYIELVMTGGILRHLTRSLIGPQVIRSLENINADWVFLATGGFSVERGITTSNILDMESKRAICERGRKIAVMADSSKLGNVLSLTVIPMGQVDILITDVAMSAERAAEISACGVEVIRV